MASPKVAQGPASDHDWQAEDDHRTLSRATEIQGDSKRMSGVKKHHKKVTRQMSSMGKSMLGGKR